MIAVHIFLLCWNRHVINAHLANNTEENPNLSELAQNAQFFLLAVCIRSAESRRRIVAEIVKDLRGETAVSGFGADVTAVPASIPFRDVPGSPPPIRVGGCLVVVVPFTL